MAVEELRNLRLPQSSLCRQVGSLLLAALAGRFDARGNAEQEKGASILMSANISPDVVILTRRELSEREDSAFKRGVERGKFEAATHASELANLAGELLLALDPS